MCTCTCIHVYNTIDTCLFVDLYQRICDIYLDDLYQLWSFLTSRIGPLTTHYCIETECYVIMYRCR
jgi:hypothetical protein